MTHFIPLLVIFDCALKKEKAVFEEQKDGNLFCCPFVMSLVDNAIFANIFEGFFNTFE